MLFFFLLFYKGGAGLSLYKTVHQGALNFLLYLARTIKASLGLYNTYGKDYALKHTSHTNLREVGYIPHAVCVLYGFEHLKKVPTVNIFIICVEFVYCLHTQTQYII